MNNKFINSIKNNDLKLFKICEKTNLHTHGLISSNRKLFYEEFNRNIETFHNADDIMALSEFIKNNINDLVTNLEDQLKLYELTIKTAINNGVTILVTDIDYRLPQKFYKNNANILIKDLNNLTSKYKDKIRVYFNIGISRHSYNRSEDKMLYNLIDTNFFYGLDLFGDETKNNIIKFKKIYKYAKKKNLILCAHVGEYGNAHSILKAINTLKLDVINHGINIVNSPIIMKKVSKKNVIFNVCPISNLKLNRVNNIKDHPIKKMIDNKLIVTINTDDELIFENSLFDEYELLYKNNILTLDELNQIKENGLIYYK